MNKLQNTALFLMRLSFGGAIIFLIALLLTGCGSQPVNAQEAREAPSVRVLQYDNGQLVVEMHVRDDASVFPHVTHYMSLDVQTSELIIEMTEDFAELIAGGNPRSTFVLNGSAQQHDIDTFEFGLALMDVAECRATEIPWQSHEYTYTTVEELVSELVERNCPLVPTDPEPTPEPTLEPTIGDPDGSRHVFMPVVGNAGMPESRVGPGPIPPTPSP